MATSAREGGSGSRERDNRKGSSSSSNPITKKQPASSSLSSNSKHSSSSSSLDQRKPFSTSASRPAPNYQKPTISSRLDPSASKTVPRRPSAATTTTTRPSERRQSLDTHVKVPRNSSSLSSSAPSRTTTTSTSSSSSIKPRGPQRSISSLSSRSGKQPAVAPSIRRSLSTTRAPTNASLGLRRSVKKTGSKSVVSDSTLEMEARDKDPLDEMIGSQEDQDEVLSLPEISEMPGQEEPLGDPVIIEQSHIALQDEHKVEEEQVGEEKLADEDDQEVVIEASSSGENEDSGIAESEEGGLEEDLNNVEEKHVVVELEESKDEEEVVEEEEEPEEEQVVKEDEQVVVEEVQPEVKKEESLAKHEIITQSGNKKEVHDYNGVIEETASKLREKRNKVRALAGAFETVISLQDHK